MRWLLLLTGVSGCDNGATCEEIAQAIAVRTWECSGESDLGFARARRLRNDLACASGEDHDVSVASGGCLAQIDDLTCADTVALGDDPVAWLAATPSCEQAFGGAPDSTSGP